MNRLVSELEYNIKDYPLKDITEKIISCAIEVHSTLGPGLVTAQPGQKLNHRGH